MERSLIKCQFDVNILLDVFLDRKPWSDGAVSLLSLCDRRVIEGCWCAASVSTVYFLLARELGRKSAQKVLRDLNRILHMTPVDSSVIDDALTDSWLDLEDAIIHASARQAGATHIVTRDPKDYSKATLVVCDAETLLAALK